MSTCIETVPGTWDDARDDAFFRATARLFPPPFCLGASVLLAGNDDEPVPTPPAPASAAPVAAPGHSAAEPVRQARGTAA